MGLSEIKIIDLSMLSSVYIDTIRGALINQIYQKLKENIK